MKNEKEHQFEEYSTQPTCPEPAPLTTKSTKQNERSPPHVKCDIDGCDKEFENETSLNAHKSAKHSSSETIGDENKSTTTKSKKKAKKRVPCTFEGCDQLFKSIQALKDHQSAKHITPQLSTSEKTTTTTTTTCETKISRRLRKKSQITCGFDDCKVSVKITELAKHQIETHSVPLRCLFGAACMNSTEKYSGMRDLINHIAIQHADSYRKRVCVFAECQNGKGKYDWFGLLQHMVSKHANYLLP